MGRGLGMRLLMVRRKVVERARRGGAGLRDDGFGGDVDGGSVRSRLQKSISEVTSSEREAKVRTYFEMIFLSELERTFHGKTLTSFSMFLGFGLGNPMMSLKKASDSALALDTVMGLNPSMFLLILFFSSTVNLVPTSASRR